MDSNNKNKSEREKGAAPPDYMPAIFGWMTIDDQLEHAREITDFTRENLQQKKFKDLSCLNSEELDQNEKQRLENLEKDLNQNRDEDIVLVVYKREIQ